MQGFDYDRIQRFVVIIGVAAVAALWLAEETGLLMVAPPAQKSLTVLPGLTAPDGQKPPARRLEAAPRPSENGAQSVEKSDKT